MSQFESTKSELLNIELERLGLVTWAATVALGLPCIPAVLVTEGDKDLNLIASSLGFDPELCFLFDDKGEHHISTMGDTYYARVHVIPVQPFNFKTMGLEQAERLRCTLEEHFPVDGIKLNYRPLFRSICADRTWPLENRSITVDEKWKVSYPNGEPVRPWAVDRILALVGEEEDEWVVSYNIVCRCVQTMTWSDH